MLEVVFILGVGTSQALGKLTGEPDLQQLEKMETQNGQVDAGQIKFMYSLCELKQ